MSTPLQAAVRDALPAKLEARLKTNILLIDGELSGSEVLLVGTQNPKREDCRLH
jgi:hypothetical protein